MSVIVGGRPETRPVDAACARCGSARLYTGAAAALTDREKEYARDLVAKEEAFAKAAAAGDSTSAAVLDLPQPGELDDLGLSARIWSGALLDPAAIDRDTILRHLGLAAGARRFVDVPGPLGSVRLDEYAVVHLEESRYERWDSRHVGYMPLVETTLKHPFEIWYGLGSIAGAPTPPNFRFLSLYQLDAIYMTHIVIYSPRRKRVVTSHRLTGWPQCMERRSGTPIYAAYVR